MAVRKSKKIGEVINGFIILDSIHVENDTKYKVKCLRCNREQIKCRHSINNKITQCDYCGKGRKKRNANGHYGEPIYLRYMEILRRIKGHEHYKKNNIKMCEEWEKDFMKFYEWALKSGFDEKLTIDRIDNSKGYSPDNCRWATIKEQANNRTSNKYIEYNGEKLTYQQFCDKYNIKKHTFYNRYRAGWSLQKIIDTPVKEIKNGRFKD